MSTVVTEACRLALEGVERARHLGLLALDPVRPAARLGPQQHLVAGEDAGIEDAIALGLPAERGPARRPGRGEHLRPAVQAVEVFADHPRIEQRQAVVGHQARHLAERVVAADVGIGCDRAHLARGQLQLFLLPGLDRHRHDLAHIGRRIRVVQPQRCPSPVGPSPSSRRSFTEGRVVASLDRGRRPRPSAALVFRTGGQAQARPRRS